MAVTPFKSSDNFNMAGFNEKITEADNTYVAKTGGSMSGALSMGNNKITNVASPVNDGDVATKGYVDGIIKKETLYTNSSLTISTATPYDLTIDVPKDKAVKILALILRGNGTTTANKSFSLFFGNPGGYGGVTIVKCNESSYNISSLIPIKTGDYQSSNYINFLTFDDAIIMREQNNTLQFRFNAVKADTTINIQIEALMLS